MIKRKRIVSLVGLLIFLSLFSFSVLAADPGHGAGVIGSADFEAGNYSSFKEVDKTL